MSTSPNDVVPAAPEETDALAIEAARPTPPPRKPYAKYDPTTGTFAVIQDGVVVRHVSSYLDMERAS